MNSASGPEVAAVGTTAFREGGAMLRQREVGVSTEDAPSKINILIDRSFRWRPGIFKKLSRDTTIKAFASTCKALLLQSVVKAIKHIG